MTVVLLSFQKRIIANKKAKGFPIGDFEFELSKLKEEVKEVEDALHEDNLPHLGEELADVAIYLLAIAEMKGLNLEDEIYNKMVKNENRKVWKENGKFKKEEGT